MQEAVVASDGGLAGDSKAVSRAIPAIEDVNHVAVEHNNRAGDLNLVALCGWPCLG
jgi:hypothetical protein